MRRIVVSSAALAFLLLAVQVAAQAPAAQAPAAAPAAAPLDGKTFAGEVGRNGGKKGDKDELVFKDGRFRSTACDKYGFGDAPYTAKVVGDAVNFEAETKSEKHGMMKWTGAVKGDHLEGTALWRKKSGKAADYWVKADAKK
jgi:hypothetical protein